MAITFHELGMTSSYTVLTAGRIEAVIDSMMVEDYKAGRIVSGGQIVYPLQDLIGRNLSVLNLEQVRIIDELSRRYAEKGWQFRLDNSRVSHKAYVLKDISLPRTEIPPVFWAVNI